MGVLEFFQLIVHENGMFFFPTCCLFYLMVAFPEFENTGG